MSINLGQGLVILFAENSSDIVLGALGSGLTFELNYWCEKASWSCREIAKVYPFCSGLEYDPHHQEEVARALVSYQQTERNTGDFRHSLPSLLFRR
ncbi:MAG: hypothetical protein Q8N36_02865, partial [bacterium]|nr:hypothetical protein [bacterium]